MRIRRRLEADLPECVRALREVHDCDGYPDRWPADPVVWLEPTEAAWVAEVDGALVGHVVLVDREDGFWVSRLFVPPSARGMRVGEALLDRARTHAGGRALMLDVIEHSSSAISLYERTGWTLLGTRGADWTMADGTIPIERIYSAERR
ncbi:GNAT family N-acetyltransferase [Rhodococcus sp. G-MC3]|uniref:GNAT family N-acetyltransferase n=1 Tax=Rhodococcus sp. G-MC3 TaxID=3046209 RepID=UPI0024B8CBF6|nr:GNAT family N-acetyltransferase [Rhodococcus sp. G-MC3]MDJ0394743.1 GNAT family N-acetyltransferase [Rhodococcus sp. G-MC3]